MDYTLAGLRASARRLQCGADLAGSLLVSEPSLSHLAPAAPFAFVFCGLIRAVARVKNEEREHIVDQGRLEQILRNDNIS